MKQIKALIIDDEPFAIEVIKELANRLTPDLVVVGTATNGIDAFESIMQTKPDLIFLDVDMPLMNGLQLVEKLPYKSLNIIFTTGSSTHAVKAIKLDAVDYLLKPIDPFEFSQAVEKVRLKISKDNPSPGDIAPTRIQFPTQDEIIYLEEDEILHIVGMGSYSQIYKLSNDEKITVSKSIGQLEEKLSSDFFRCHNSHIINLNYVTSFLKKDGFLVLLKNGTQVEVSRRTKDELLRRLNSRSR